MGKCECCGSIISDKDAYGVAESGAIFCVDCLSKSSIHIIPEDDIKDHDASINCHCIPYEESGIWFHNAFDCRELKSFDGIIWN